MQCKDIPDEVFLAAVRTASRLTGGGWVMLWDLGCVLAGNPEHLDSLRAHDDHPLGECFPWRLTRAKADKLIKRGLLEGCSCGCRGDFYIPGEWPVENQVKAAEASVTGSDVLGAGTGRIVIGSTVVRFKAPNLEGLGQAVKELADSMQATFREFRRMCDRMNQSKKLSAVHSQYRRKRGRRRFR